MSDIKRQFVIRPGISESIPCFKVYFMAVMHNGREPGYYKWEYKREKHHLLIARAITGNSSLTWKDLAQTGYPTFRTPISEAQEKNIARIIKKYIRAGGVKIKNDN